MASAEVQDLAICKACGTQYERDVDQPPQSCKICDDPRQFVPPDGQQWTSLRQLHKAHKQEIKPLRNAPGIWTIRTEPQVGIGQRAFLITTPRGNVLWDCIAYLDDVTRAFVEAKGGLSAVVISHPHYYTTHLAWAQALACPVFIAAEDEEWCVTRDVGGRRRLVHGVKEEVVPGVTACKVGGHFPGSLVLHYLPEGKKPEEAMLFVADSLVTAPSALYFVDRVPGTISYTFMWSIPNQIPLPPGEILKMWRVLEGLEFGSTHGAFKGMEVFDSKVKGRVLESMKIQCRAMGWDEKDAEILKENWGVYDA